MIDIEELKREGGAPPRNEAACDDCGLPISVCNARAMIREAINRGHGYGAILPHLEAAYLAAIAERDALAARVKAADELADMVQDLPDGPYHALYAALAAYRATDPQKEKSE